MLVKQKGRLFNLPIPRGLKVAYIHGKGLGLLANRQFKAGQKLIPLRGELVPASRASDEAVQFDANRFIDTPYIVPEDFINHSCSPNAAIDFDKKCFVAIKTIKKNSEITFNYHTTEYDIEKMGGGFDCLCGSKNCYKKISGFRYLSFSQKKRLEKYLSPFIKEKFRKEGTKRGGK